MEPLASNAPEIIRAAAASPLGILSLMVMALSCLAFVFFRRSRESWKFASLLLLFLGAAAFGLAFVRESQPDDRTTQQPQHPRRAGLKGVMESWIAEAEKARTAATIVSNAPLPSTLSAARAEFERAWAESSLEIKRSLDLTQVSKALSYLNRLYRVQEKDSPTQTNANGWADEAIRYFAEVQDRKLLTSALLDKAAIYLDLAQLGHDDKAQFEKMAREGDAVMVRALQTADVDQKPDVLRITSRFHYNLARPQSFRLSDDWDNNYLLLAYAKVREAYERAPGDRRNANQLARTVIKVSKNPPQDKDPAWAVSLREAQLTLKKAWEADREKLVRLDQRLSPLHVLGVVSLETVAREWRDLSPKARTIKAKAYLQEIDTDALAPLREAAALLQNSQLRKQYGFDIHYDISRALAVRTGILQAIASAEATATFADLQRNLSAAKAAARTSQLEAALNDVNREITFMLLSAKERRSLRQVLAIAGQ